MVVWWDDGVMRKLAELSHDQIIELCLDGLEMVANEVKTILAHYPPPPKYPLRWKSRKQEFYVKRILLKNQPYQRGTSPMSQRLQLHWTIDRGEDKVVLGNPVTYAKFVQSKAYQQPFHADTGWVTEVDAVEQVDGRGVFQQAVEQILTKMWR